MLNFRFSIAIAKKQMCIAVCILLAISCRTKKDGTGISPDKSAKEIAVIKTFSGDVKFKRALTSSWNKIESETMIYEGDELYTGPDGYLKINYKTLDADFEMGSYSIMQITTSLPEKTVFARNNNSMEYKASSDQARRSLSLNLARKKTETSEKKLSLSEKPKRKLQIDILDPGQQIALLSKKFPTTIPIQIDTKWTQQNIWYYLWADKNMDHPIWISSHLGSNPHVLIPQPGNYILMLTSDDRNAESKPISIQAQKRISLKGLIPTVEKNIDKSLVVVLQ